MWATAECPRAADWGGREHREFVLKLCFLGQRGLSMAAAVGSSEPAQAVAASLAQILEIFAVLT